MAQVGRQGDGAQSGGEELEDGDVQPRKPLHRDRYVPIEAVAETAHSWRIAVGGSIGRSDELNGERLRLRSLRSLERRRDGCASRVQKGLTMAPQLLVLERVGANEGGRTFLLHAQGPVRLVEAVHDRGARAVDHAEELEHADERAVVLEGQPGCHQLVDALHGAQELSFGYQH